MIKQQNELKLNSNIKNTDLQKLTSDIIKYPTKYNNHNRTLSQKFITNFMINNETKIIKEKIKNETADFLKLQKKKGKILKD